MMKRSSRRKIAAAMMESLEARQFLSATWFVSPAGSNSNAGSLSAPFQTIQAAANVAQPGDHVEIMAGVYDETVTPKNSGTSADPIVYEAYDNQSVTVSGANPVADWTLVSGDVYSAPIGTNLGEGNNEVFVDGAALNEARWPNTSLNLSDPTLAHAQSVTLSGNSATIYDSNLTQPAGYWNGAIIHISPGDAWTAQTGAVTSSAPGQVTFTYSADDQYELPKAGNAYYLTGTFKALQSTGEFYVDPTNNLVYMSTPTGDKPGQHDVEVKQRQDAFNLSGLSNITVQNITIFSATIQTDSHSADVTLNHLNALYVGQYLIQSNGWKVPTDSGLMLDGPDDMLENSTIAWSAGDGVYVGGDGSIVSNNVIHDVDNDGSDGAGVRIYASDVQVEHNTIYNTGRDGIQHSGQGLQIEYNTIYDCGLQTTEAGGIYCVNTDGGGTVIAYNNISDMHSGGFGATGLFLDNYSNNYNVHDNVVTNVDTAIKLNYTSQDNDIYNNTLSGTLYSVSGNFTGNWDGTKFTDNVLIGKTAFQPGAAITGNATAAGPGVGAPSFVSGSNSSVGVGNLSSQANADPTEGSTPPASNKSTSSAASTSSTSSTSTSSSSSTSATTTTSAPAAAPPPPAAPIIYTDPQPLATTAPAPTPAGGSSPTVTALMSNLTADRAALANAVRDRSKAIQQLQTTEAADLSAYRSASRQLQAQRELAHVRVGVESPALFSDLQIEISQLLAQAQDVETDVRIDRQTDFTGIAAARAKISSDVKAVHAAKAQKASS